MSKIVIVILIYHRQKPIKKTPWSESASELYQQSDRHVVSVTDLYGRILDFLYRSHYFSIE
jgi:hypothetical protein